MGKYFQGHIRANRTRPHLLTRPPPRSPPPQEYRWDDVGGVNYLTGIRNQHIPQYCGSCWAQAASSSLSDRIKIARKAAWPDIVIAPQVLISCGPGDGCHGGEAGAANEWIHKNGITDETCSIYQARGHDNGLPCNQLAVCESCWPGRKQGEEVCTSPPKYHRYTVEEYGDIEGDTPEEQEKNMMAEIYHRGPISCGIAVTDDLYLNYTGGVYYDTTNNTEIDHDISVVGYGVDAATGWKYWLIRNSWGTYWGENGFFRLRRGVNNIAIESGACSWATPKDTWSQDFNITTNELKTVAKKPVKLADPVSPAKSWNEMLLELIQSFVTFANQHKRAKIARPTCVAGKSKFAKGPRVLSPLPSKTIRNKDLPKVWDWRNINGTNYLSLTVNQHVPHYCGSCWAQGTASALADRFIVADRKRFANAALSPQAIINCRAGGSCQGGNPAAVYEFAHDVGIPDATCLQYDAQNHGPVEDCTVPNIDLCRDCTWPPPPVGETGKCWAREKFHRYFVSEYGEVSGAKHMKKEIYKRGPIGCGIMVTEKFEAYDGGIYSEENSDPEINHELSIVGWGFDEETGTEYWIGRNSWGTYWGEYGFFRIKMHEDNLGIETACVWAVPRVTHGL